LFTVTPQNKLDRLTEEAFTESVLWRTGSGWCGPVDRAAITASGERGVEAEGAVLPAASGIADAKIAATTASAKQVAARETG
jgi:hypothetical protein